MHAGQQIVVAAEILRGRVQHVVDAGGQRADVVRRAERGVDQRFDAVLAAQTPRTARGRRRSGADSSATR